MKKIITLSAILALSMTTVVEAKGFRSSGFRSVSGKSLSAPKTTSSTANQSKDATFANTPKQATTTQPTSANGNRVANFATGAAAGYILSNALAPNTALANGQAVENSQNLANTTNVMQFKSIGGQVDPYLIEKTDGYRRYCISGVQYLAAVANGSTAPTVMVTPEGKPLTCQLVQ